MRLPLWTMPTKLHLPWSTYTSTTYSTVTWLLGTYPLLPAHVTSTLIAHTIIVVSLTPPHLYLGENGELKLSEFGHSRWDGPSNCRLYDNTRPLLKVRWTAPEVIESLHFTKHSEVW